MPEFLPVFFTFIVSVEKSEGGGEPECLKKRRRARRGEAEENEKKCLFFSVADHCEAKKKKKKGKHRLVSSFCSRFVMSDVVGEFSGAVP